MRSHPLALSAALAAILVLSAAPVLSQGDTDTEEPPEFTDAFMANAEAIETGEVIWEEQCRHCHGRSAYPGKAPKLKPRRYDAAFVYDRVTNGYRKMPPWKDVYDREERMAITAYVLSPEFSP